MPELANDCFRTGDDLVSLATASAAIARIAVPVTGVESLPLAECLGRWLAEDVVAGRDLPPNDNAAVDGYAFYHADLTASGATRLAVTGRVAAGHPLGRLARRGEALRIFTGAPMPAGDGDSGPDTVAMQEDCGRDGEFVILPSGSRKGSHRRQAGEDVRTGDAALRVGSRLRPQEIGLASALGVTRLSVHRRLRIAVFSTGDELVEAGVPLGPGQIHDSNRHTLSALLVGLGAEITDLGILRDSEAQIRARLADSAREHDAIVTSGGMSTGEEDHVKAAVDGIGRLHAWRLAIKPGRPVALGQIGRVPFIGLPGNPVAVMVTFLLLARPLLLRLAGAEPKEPPRYRVVAGFDYTKKAGRREFLRARLEAAAGGPVARRFERDGAGILSSLTQSDGLIELPEELTHLASGSPVDYLPYNEVLS